MDGKGWPTKTNGKMKIILYKIILFFFIVSNSLAFERKKKYNRSKYIISGTLEKLCHIAKVRLTKVL